jgi:hypothetical protein
MLHIWKLKVDAQAALAAFKTKSLSKKETKVRTKLKPSLKWRRF